MGRPSKYPREFRESAVEMVRSTGRPVGQIARELGMSDSTLTNWVRIDRQARGETEPEEQLTVSEKAELARLRRENAQLRMEKEILKKSGGLLRAGVDEVTRFRFIDAERTPATASAAVVTTLSRLTNRSPILGVELRLIWDKRMRGANRS